MAVKARAQRARNVALTASLRERYSILSRKSGQRSKRFRRQVIQAGVGPVDIVVSAPDGNLRPRSNRFRNQLTFKHSSRSLP